MPTAAPAQLVPGAQSFNEALVRIKGVVATCVEASALVILHVKNGTPLTAQNDLALTEQLQMQGLADWRGATNWQAASQLLAQHGVANQTYSLSQGDSQADLLGVLVANAGRQPILVGLPQAFNLRDDWTGQYYDAGVNGHAITVVGQDTSGFIVADPNTPQASSGGFVHYSPGTLMRAGMDSLVLPLGGPGATDALGTEPGSIQAVSASMLQAVSAAPGFAPIAQALDDAEQFDPLDVTGVVPFLRSLAGDLGAGFLRAIFVIVGLVIILVVLFNLLRRAEPQIAGAANLTAALTG